ncbi:unnamed protein product [Amoebophrya sp. A120]|nr:unnamed protein product [Amoebophrya sp. A120]|eukprot:GSA120T00001011001.1
MVMDSTLTRSTSASHLATTRKPKLNATAIPNLPGTSQLSTSIGKKHLPRQNSRSIIGGCRIARNRERFEAAQSKFIIRARPKKTFEFRQSSLPSSTTRGQVCQQTSLTLDELPTWEVLERHLLQFYAYGKDAIAVTNGVGEDFGFRDGNKRIRIYICEDKFTEEYNYERLGMPHNMALAPANSAMDAAPFSADERTLARKTILPSKPDERTTNEKLYYEMNMLNGGGNVTTTRGSFSVSRETNKPKAATMFHPAHDDPGACLSQCGCRRKRFYRCITKTIVLFCWLFFTDCSFIFFPAGAAARRTTLPEQLQDDLVDKPDQQLHQEMSDTSAASALTTLHPGSFLNRTTEEHEQLPAVVGVVTVEHDGSFSSLLEKNYEEDADTDVSSVLEMLNYNGEDADADNLLDHDREEMMPLAIMNHEPDGAKETDLPPRGPRGDGGRQIFTTFNETASLLEKFGTSTSTGTSTARIFLHHQQEELEATSVVRVGEIGITSFLGDLQSKMETACTETIKHLMSSVAAYFIPLEQVEKWKNAVVQDLKQNLATLLATAAEIVLQFVPGLATVLDRLLYWGFGTALAKMAEPVLNKIVGVFREKVLPAFATEATTLLLHEAMYIISHQLRNYLVWGNEEKQTEHDGGKAKAEDKHPEFRRSDALNADQLEQGITSHLLTRQKALEAEQLEAHETVQSHTKSRLFPEFRRVLPDFHIAPMGKKMQKMLDSFKNGVNGVAKKANHAMELAKTTLEKVKNKLKKLWQHVAHLLLQSVFVTKAVEFLSLFFFQHLVQKLVSRLGDVLYSVLSGVIPGIPIESIVDPFLVGVVPILSAKLLSFFKSKTAGALERVFGFARKKESIGEESTKDGRRHLPQTLDKHLHEKHNEKKKHHERHHKHKGEKEASSTLEKNHPVDELKSLGEELRKITIGEGQGSQGVFDLLRDGLRAVLSKVDLGKVSSIENVAHVGNGLLHAGRGALRDARGAISALKAGARYALNEKGEGSGNPRNPLQQEDGKKQADEVEDSLVAEMVTGFDKHPAQAGSSALEVPFREDQIEMDDVDVVPSGRWRSGSERSTYGWSALQREQDSNPRPMAERGKKIWLLAAGEDADGQQPVAASSFDTNDAWQRFLHQGPQEGKRIDEGSPASFSISSTTSPALPQLRRQVPATQSKKLSLIEFLAPKYYKQTKAAALQDRFSFLQKRHLRLAQSSHQDDAFLGHVADVFHKGLTHMGGALEKMKDKAKEVVLRSGGAVLYDLAETNLGGLKSVLADSIAAPLARLAATTLAAPPLLGPARLVFSLVSESMLQTEAIRDKLAAGLVPIVEGVANKLLESLNFAGIFEGLRASLCIWFDEKMTDLLHKVLKGWKSKKEGSAGGEGKIDHLKGHHEKTNSKNHGQHQQGQGHQNHAAAHKTKKSEGRGASSTSFTQKAGPTDMRLRPNNFPRYALPSPRDAGQQRAQRGTGDDSQEEQGLGPYLLEAPAKTASTAPGAALVQLAEQQQREGLRLATKASHVLDLLADAKESLFEAKTTLATAFANGLSEIKDTLHNVVAGVSKSIKVFLTSSAVEGLLIMLATAAGKVLSQVVALIPFIRETPLPVLFSVEIAPVLVLLFHLNVFPMAGPDALLDLDGAPALPGDETSRKTKISVRDWIQAKVTKLVDAVEGKVGEAVTEAINGAVGSLGGDAVSVSRHVQQALDTLFHHGKDHHQQHHHQTKPAPAHARAAKPGAGTGSDEDYATIPDEGLRQPIATMMASNNKQQAKKHAHYFDVP